MQPVYEWRKDLTRVGPPVLAPSIIAGAQFRSVYGFPASTATKINQQAHMKNLKGMMIYSDTLLIDIDNPDHVDVVLSKLSAFGYEIWTTGNRGIHIHIPLETPMIGVNVIYSQIQWLKSIGVWSYIDISIYKPAGQFRAPGATHRKTGKLKLLDRIVEGAKPNIKLLTPPPTIHKAFKVEASTPEAVFDFHWNLLQKRSTGDRHGHMFILWRSGQAAGLTESELEDVIYWWNEHMTSVPHPTYLVTKKIRGFK